MRSRSLYIKSRLRIVWAGGKCNMVFVATQQDMLYAFNADYDNTQQNPQEPQPLWSIDLAKAAGGTYFGDCSSSTPPPPCGPIKPFMGVLGTPVIDTSAQILYVVTIVSPPLRPEKAEYYIHAIDYTTANEKPNSPFQITDTYSGPQQTAQQCATAALGGTITFDPSTHYQRAGLLLLPLNGGSEVYVAFTAADVNELANGWLMSFSYNTSSHPNIFHLDNTFVTTPYGTGGGIWMDGAGLASDGTYIYLSTGNGTFDVGVTSSPSVDYGDSVLKLDPSSLTVKDSFTPIDVFGQNFYQLRCFDDVDLDSGGIMIFPDVFWSGTSLLIGADKESKLYVMDRDNLGGFSKTGTDNITEEFTTNPMGVGYWGSPAYWEWVSGGQTSRAIYYSVNATVIGGVVNGDPPDPMNMYVLNSTDPNKPPVPTAWAYSTPTKFCGYGAQPSVSSSTSQGVGVATTGIVWGYEDNNPNNPRFGNCQGKPSGPAVLHGYDASNIGTELYNSTGLTESVSFPTVFSTPMVFNGKVYIGTQNGYNPAEVDVFGHCNASQPPACFSN